MEISRDYINSRDILDFPINDRFFKLDVNGMLALENIIPNPPQIAIVNALNDPRHRFVTACVSRRVGKSFIAYNLGFLKLLEPGTLVLVIAPNYSLANIGWDLIKALIRKHGIKTEKENAKDKEIELSNGSLFKLASAGNADSAVGRSYDFIIFDEAAISDKGGDAFQVQLMPTLDKPNSKALFISTPRGNNWFKKFFEYGFSTETEMSKKWVSIHATYRDNPRVDLATIEDARRTTSDAYFRQEYEADFGVFEGQIYDTFDVERHVKDLKGMRNFFAKTEDFDTIVGIDVGYRDPTAVVTVKYHHEQDIFYIIEEYLQAEKTTSEHAQYLLDLERREEPDFIFVDSAAAQFRHDLATDFDISTRSAKKSVNDGIRYLQDLFWQDKVIVCSSCKGVISALQGYKWYMDEDSKQISRERPFHDDNSHFADAIRYALYSVRRG